MFKEIDESKKSELGSKITRHWKLKENELLPSKQNKVMLKFYMMCSMLLVLFINLVSVGQLHTSGYKDVFNNDACAISDKTT